MPVKIFYLQYSRLPQGLEEILLRNINNFVEIAGIIPTETSMTEAAS
jgi:hypothetical protein